MLNMLYCTEVVQMSTHCCSVFPNESFLQVSMSQLLIGGWFTDNKDMVAEAGSWQPYELHGGECLTLTKKENQIFLTYKEIENGAVAKSYVTTGLLIYY